MNALDIKAALMGVKAKIIPVELPGLPVMYLKQMSGAQRDEIENYALEHRVPSKDDKLIPDIRGLRALTIIFCLVDEDGVPIFGRRDADAIASIPAWVTDKLFEEAQKLNGFQAEENKKMGESSDGEVSDGSGSNSPSFSEVR